MLQRLQAIPKIDLTKLMTARTVLVELPRNDQLVFLIGGLTMLFASVIADSVSIVGWDVPLEHAKFWVSVLGFVGTVAASSLGAWQYRRADKWRRAEFVAKEIKDFEESPAVRNVMSMVALETHLITIGPARGRVNAVTRLHPDAVAGEFFYSRLSRSMELLAFSLEPALGRAV